MNPNEPEAVFEVARGLRRQLEYLDEAGFFALPRTAEATAEIVTNPIVNNAPPEAPGEPIVAKIDSNNVNITKTPAAFAFRSEGDDETRRSIAAEAGEVARTIEQKQAALDAIRGKVSNCKLCRLCEKRTNAVPGEGSAAARVMFVGEGPGQTEDELGRPFVGRAGQLLTKIIESGMGLKREDVFIANIVKCRPPENRDPMPDEVAACVPYLNKQIEIIDPQVIIPLGRHSMRELAGVGERDTISRVRGKIYRLHGRAVIPTFHPAYLLRNPPEKVKVWADIQLAMKELGLPIPQRDAGAGSA